MSSAAQSSVDEIDRAILRELTTDGRMAVAEVARRTNIARATAYIRINRLVRSGAIKRFTTRVAPEAVGITVAALVLVTADQGAWRELRDAFDRVPQVEYVGVVASDFDFLLLVRARSMDELRYVVLERLVELPGVRGSKTAILLDEQLSEPYIP